MSLKIGIDFGGVLSIHDGQNNGSEHRTTVINMPGALESLQKLKDQGHKLYLISFAGKSRSQETQDSIKQTCPNLFDGLYFVKDKGFKKDVCDFLGCDLLIDDRQDVLDTLKQGKTVPVLFDETGTLKNWADWETLLTLPLLGASPNPTAQLQKKIYALV
uniref:FCP1 homology domain-containing protein n=1 Tax=viral metagenome TaxID=1070528 RepID=A0A6C0JT83_9ZZZZ